LQSFQDSDVLVIAANARTFRALIGPVLAPLHAAGDIGPQGQMITMSHACLGYALDYTYL
jgi:hypothetical protein